MRHDAGEEGTVTLERRRAPKQEALFELLGTFPWSSWQAQSEEEVHRKLHELVARRRAAIEFFDLVGDDGELVTTLAKDGTFRHFHIIGGGALYMEVGGSEENETVSFFLRYYSLRIAQL